MNTWFKQLNGEYLNWIFQYCLQKSVCWRFLPAWLCMPYNPSLNVNISLDPQQCLSTQAWYFFIGPKSDHCFVLSVIESLTAFCEPCSRFVKNYFLERCDQFRVVFGGFAFFIRWILLEVLDQQADGTRLVVGHFIGNAPLARLPEINFDQKYFPPFSCFYKEAIIRFTTRIRY